MTNEQKRTLMIDIYEAIRRQHPSPSDHLDIVNTLWTVLDELETNAIKENLRRAKHAIEREWLTKYDKTLTTQGEYEGLTYHINNASSFDKTDVEGTITFNLPEDIE